MSTIDSSSTAAQVRAAMADNASYEEDGSVSKCKAYITACRVWLTNFAFDESEVGQGGSRQRLDKINEGIREGLEDARNWLADQPATDVTLATAGYSKIDLSGGRE